MAEPRSVIPDRLAETVIAVHGAAGVAWLAALPALIDEYQRRWSITAGPPFPELTYNYVAPVTHADGTAVVLKCGVPHPELAAEIDALRLYDGRGAVRLLDADTGRGVLLLERLEPGTMLAEIAGDVEATAVAAGVMRELWRPPPAVDGFPTLDRWFAAYARLRARYHGGSGPLPATLLDRAEAILAELNGSAAAPVLLHGDLHHFNILAARRAPWLAIDPKGVIGDPAYEVAPFLCNPRPRLLAMPRPDRILARRVAQLAEALGLDRARVHGWGLAHAVLSACWSIEDGQDWRYAIGCAELLTVIKV